MDCSVVRSRLSLHADGDLPSGERELVEAHLTTCEACRGVLRDIDRLRRTATSLGPITPPDHVWLQIAGQIRLERPDAHRAPAATRERRAAAGQWVGLAAALLLISTGAYFFVRSTPAAPPVSSNVTAAPTVQSVADELTRIMEQFDKTIADLNQLAQQRDSQLDPVLAASLDQNIRVINAAIEDSRNALQQNPGNEMARESLLDALQRKITVLTATVDLMNEMRKGNQAGALEAAGGLRKKS